MTMNGMIVAAFLLSFGLMCAAITPGALVALVVVSGVLIGSVNKATKESKGN